METKVCTKCKCEKSIEDFGKRGRSKDGFESQCKDCYNLRKRKWSNSSLGMEAYLKHLQRMRSKKLRAIDYLGGKCADCNGVFHECVYDFHHENPENKERTIASMRMFSFEKIKLELDKCVLLCANCHRLRHYS